MSASPHVIEVEQQDFQQAVIERSRDVPVVVDFWAPWCGPCRTLGPVLEKLAERDDGRWVLAKVNTENNREIAMQYRIQGIPAVKAFVDGEVVEEFTGALPEYAVDQWLAKIIPSAEDLEIEEAIAAEDAGELEEAASIYKGILERDSENAGAMAGLVRVALAHGDIEGAATVVDDIPDHLWGTTDGALERSWLAVEAARARDESDLTGDDLETTFERAMYLASREEWEAALDLLLVVLGTDRSFRDDVGRIGMVRVFEAMGTDSDLANIYRGKMGAVMYV